MHAQVDQQQFLSFLLEASRFTAAKSLTPVLAGIWCSVTENTITLRASTGQALYEVQFAAQETQPGTLIVPAPLLVSVLKSLDSGSCTLTLEQDQLWIRQGTVEFQVAPMPLEGFPEPLSEDGTTPFVLPLDAFSQAVEQVSIAASKDETKPVLTSLLLEMTQPNALVTSDGFRLFRLAVDLSLDQAATLLLPARFLKEVLALAKKGSETLLTCQWNKEQGQLILTLGPRRIQLGLVSGDFPPYRNIIPEATAFSCTVDRELLKQRIQQVMVLAKELSNIIVFSVEGDDLVLNSQVSTRGKSQARLPILVRESEVPRFACNGLYVLDFLSTIEEETVLIQGNDPLKPLLFGVPGRPEMLYLIMPFRLS